MNNKILKLLLLFVSCLALYSCSDSSTDIQNGDPAKDMIFFVGYTSNNDVAVYSIGINGEGLSSISAQGYIYSSPVGNTVIYTRYIDSIKATGVYSMDVFGYNEKLLFTRKLDYAILSPDAKFICYHVPGNSPRSGDIFLYNIKEGKETEITDSLIPGYADQVYITLPVFSLDSKKILFGEAYTTTDLFVYDITNKSKTSITSDFSLNVTDGMHFRPQEMDWKADGSAICYTIFRAANNFTIAIKDILGNHLDTLSTSYASLVRYNPTKDQVAFVAGYVNKIGIWNKETGEVNNFEIPIDTTNFRSPIIEGLQWSEDGTELLVLLNNYSGPFFSNIIRVNAATGNILLNKKLSLSIANMTRGRSLQSK